ncbi:hypothetical protein TEQG_08075 [Trichophyton equinum CBS 127.97]|uniref:Uncharacterized protein n=1 Tax=Trichophyton equinum (strain ATCC MYA-4606 / CBS 127.97) TaxID=559882 RepID=F2Q4H8_TRIEC|nr:hypothetical protein TEQG_08075 [Trichophyton equinum CBS 127.97]
MPWGARHFSLLWFGPILASTHSPPSSRAASVPSLLWGRARAGYGATSGTSIGYLERLELFIPTIGWEALSNTKMDLVSLGVSGSGLHYQPSLQELTLYSQQPIDIILDTWRESFYTYCERGSENQPSLKLPTRNGNASGLAEIQNIWMIVSFRRTCIFVTQGRTIEVRVAKYRHIPKR